MRKPLILILLALLVSMSWAQTPESFNYQAALKNSDGEMLAGQNVSVRISILQGSGTGSSVYSETHSAQTNDNGIINLKIGEGDNPTTDFSAIDWGSANYYLKIEMDETGGTSYTSLGASQLLSVPYALYSKAATNLGDDKVYTTASDTLFVVKDHDGNVVFAVFPDGAKVIVNETTKGSIGGFAVSGRNPTKAEEVDIFKVTPDSTRIYIPEESKKGSIGGFAVSGRNPTKAGVNEYFNVSGKSSSGLDVVNPSEPRMVWYPKREAFLVGKVLIEHQDSVGLNSIATGFESKAIGDYSQAFGNQSVARKNNSTAIGKGAVAGGESSYAIGDMAITDDNSTSSYAIGSNAYAYGSNSYAIGNGAYSRGNGSFAFGAGGRDSTGAALPITTEAVGANSFALGLGAKSLGINSFSIGTGTVTTSNGLNAVAIGFGSIASGKFAVALGYRNTSSGPSSMTWGGIRSGTTDYTNIASGKGSTAWGFRTTASGYISTSWGSDTEAPGWNGTAWGNNSVASGYCATAWGKNSLANKNYNTAWLTGEAIGYQTTAAGYDVIANSYNSFVVGRTNDTIYNHTEINYYDNISPWSYIQWYDDDPLFVVGNGSSSFGGVGRRNALTILKDGTTIIGWDTSVKSEASNPDTAYVRSVKMHRDNGFLFYVHGEAGGTSSWNNLSDLRLKQNVKTIDGALDKVLKLRGVSFEWKDPEKKGSKLGFIAQEAINIIPEVVNGSESTNYTMQYAPITAVLVEALKEEHKKVEKLEKQVEEMQAKLDELIKLMKE